MPDKKPTTKKNLGGRPTKYKASYNEEARKLCLLGMDDERLSKYFEVSVSTLNLWKLEHPKFSESIKSGKEKADAQIANSLYQKAKKGDVRACEFWLKNRQPETFRDVQKVDAQIDLSGSLNINVIKQKKDGNK